MFLYNYCASIAAQCDVRTSSVTFTRLSDIVTVQIERRHPRFDIRRSHRRGQHPIGNIRRFLLRVRHRIVPLGRIVSSPANQRKCNQLLLLIIRQIIDCRPQFLLNRIVGSIIQYCNAAVVHWI